MAGRSPVRYPEGGERKAREITEKHSTLFSYPLAEAITSWDFNDGWRLKAPSGFALEEKPLAPNDQKQKLNPDQRRPDDPGTAAQGEETLCKSLIFPPSG